MNKSEYLLKKRNLIEALNAEYMADKPKKFGVDDVICSSHGLSVSIQVDEIFHHIRSNGDYEIYYGGPVLTKQLKPRKDGQRQTISNEYAIKAK